jgi:hypothetical protein
MTQSVVALFDDRPFFEKAVAYGVQHGVLDQAKLDAIQTDAPKGMVQIARYFGSEFLRPELEKAKDRIVNMVSLTLQIQSGGDLRKAAVHLREHSFMSRSKAASDMLKALIVMPQNTHFGMNEHGGFSDKHIPQLAKWSLCNLTDYQAELAKRQQVTHVIDAAIWMAEYMGFSSDDLKNETCSAEAVISTVLLAETFKCKELPDWMTFQEIIKKLRNSKKAIKLKTPENLPTNLKPAVFWVREKVNSELSKLSNSQIPLEDLFKQNIKKTGEFVGRYFWVTDNLTEIDQFYRQASTIWIKATGDHSDDSSLLTLFLCIATASAKKTILTEKSAKALIRKIRKSDIQPALASSFIQNYAPDEHKDDYLDVWEKFIDDSLDTLKSDHDYKFHDALRLLRHECNVVND